MEEGTEEEKQAKKEKRAVIGGNCQQCLARRNKAAKAFDSELRREIYRYASVASLRKTFANCWKASFGRFSDKAQCPREAFNACQISALSDKYAQFLPRTSSSPSSKTSPRVISFLSPDSKKIIVEWAVRTIPLRWQFCR